MRSSLLLAPASRACFGADAVCVLDSGGFDGSMWHADNDAVGLCWGFAEFDAAQAADKLLLERLEATAAPEHERYRENQPAEEADAGWF